MYEIQLILYIYVGTYSLVLTLCNRLLRILYMHKIMSSINRGNFTYSFPIRVTFN